MPGESGGRRRTRGYVRQRGSSYQVMVYAGVDPLTGKDSYLSESTRDEREVERIRTRLLGKVDQQRRAATSASLGYALDAWLEVHDAESTTVADYRSYADRVIKPAIGDVPLAKLNARTLEQLYAQLRRCRARCGGKSFVEHRTDDPHDCEDLDCAQHVCRPFGASTVRQVHHIISGALSAAVRWEWIPANPASVAKKPRRPAPKPSPPSADEAARIMSAATAEDESWGTLIWLFMVTGARRGELLALRWFDLDLAGGTLEIRRAYVKRSGAAQEKDTKTHQMRRIALDPATVELLQAHRDRYDQLMLQLDQAPSDQAYVFSYEPDHSRPCDPSAISHRYTRMCRRLGITSHLHTLRHYSATELIAAGVDIRTVAGRLGHGGGGTTTLRVYAAWVPESDKRAAAVLASRMNLTPNGR